MRGWSAILAVALVISPPGARAADLVVWWQKANYAQEDEAVREIIAAFEQKTGKQVELDFQSYEDMQTTVQAAVEAGQPPDFLFGGGNTVYSLGQWAYEGRLIDLSDEILPFASLFDPDALAFATLFDASTGRRSLYELPMGIATNHIHVWRNLLEQAGFTLDNIPKQWEPFWAFWCDRVQPAVRRATGRDNIYGVGLAMSIGANDTLVQFDQFIQAYEANYVSREGKLIIDDPEIRRRLIKTIGSYTAIYRKGCAPPDSIDWTTSGNNNNQAFLTGKVVMVLNDSLSIPNARSSASVPTTTITTPRRSSGRMAPTASRSLLYPTSMRQRSSERAGTFLWPRSSCAFS
jgi:multiple sugar transport system substrate-binding protein